MITITNNLSTIIMMFFGTSTFIAVTTFFQQLSDEIPNLNNIVSSPGSLQMAIYSLLGALITFFVKQATSIKEIEKSTKNTETHMKNTEQHMKNTEDHMEKAAEGIMKLVSLQRGRNTESQTRRIILDEENDK